MNRIYRHLSRCRCLEGTGGIGHGGDSGSGMATGPSGIGGLTGSSFGGGGGNGWGSTAENNAARAANAAAATAQGGWAAGLGLTDGSYGSMDAPTGGFTSSNPGTNPEVAGGMVSLARAYAKAISPGEVNEGTLARDRAESAMDQNTINGFTGYRANIGLPSAAYGQAFAAGALQGAQQAFSGGLAGVDGMDRAGDPGFSEGAYAGTLGQQSNSFTNPANAERGFLGSLRDTVSGISRGDAVATNAAVESYASGASYNGEPSSDLSALRSQISQGNVQSVNGSYAPDNVGLGLTALGYGLNLAKTLTAPTLANFANSVYGGYNLAQAATVANKLGAFGGYGWSNGPSDSDGPGGGADGEANAYAGSTGTYNRGMYSPEATYALASGYADVAPTYDQTPSLALRRRAGQDTGYRVTSPQHSDPYAAFRS